MALQLTLHTQQTPSIFNKDMLLGMLIGSLLPVPGGAIAGATIGAALGGLIGKNRIEHQNREGRQVGVPSFWNKETLIGSLVGHYAGSILGVAAAIGVAAAGMAAGLSSVAVALPALGAAVAAWTGATALATYAGGKTGKERMTAEFEEAKQQQVARERVQGRLRELERSAGREPQQEQGINVTSDHLQKLQAQRLLAAAQKNVDNKVMER